MIRIALFILFPQVLLAQYKSNLKLDLNKISLEVVGDSKFQVGEKMIFSVQVSAKRDVEVYDLETGYIHFSLQKFNGSSYLPVKYNGIAATGGGYRIATYEGFNGEMETIWEELSQNLVVLDQGQSIKRSFDLLSILGSYQWTGSYKLIVEYESQVLAETKFDITFNYESSVERFLGFLAESVLFDFNSTLNTNYYLLAYPEEKRYYGPDSLHYLQAPILQAWWEEHRELILKVESVLNQEQYKDMLYENRMPKLLRKLEKGEGQERIEARNELYRILGKPEWKPSASDTEEEIQTQVEKLSVWWEENKELINWVNRVILENQL